MPLQPNSKNGSHSLLAVSGLIFVARASWAALKEVMVLARHWRGRLRARRYRGQRNLNLHFGCGPNIKAGWVNIDLSVRADLQLDLRKRLPFEANSCDQTYSEHFFEHLDYPDDALQFLSECYRVTRPGGIINVGVPDAGAVLMLYSANYERDESAKQPWHPSWVRTWMGRVNWLFRQNYTYYLHQHRFAYDFRTLQLILSEAGFVEIRSRQFDPALDSELRKGSTLYVEGRKPAS